MWKMRVSAHTGFCWQSHHWPGCRLMGKMRVSAHTGFCWWSHHWPGCRLMGKMSVSTHRFIGKMRVSAHTGFCWWSHHCTGCRLMWKTLNCDSTLSFYHYILSGHIYTKVSQSKHCLNIHHWPHMYKGRPVNPSTVWTLTTGHIYTKVSQSIQTLSQHSPPTVLCAQPWVPIKWTCFVFLSVNNECIYIIYIVLLINSIVSQCLDRF